jgi:hypothetical protein
VDEAPIIGHRIGPLWSRVKVRNRFNMMKNGVERVNVEA